MSAKTTLPVGIVTFRLEEKIGKFVRCDICHKYPNIVKRYCEANNPPRITKSEGVRFLTNTIKDHVNTQYHAECVKAQRLETIHSDEEEEAPMNVFINKANKFLIDHVSKLMIQVFNDAKRLNLSAYSWPSRYVVGEASSSYDSQNQSSSIIAPNINLQYVNPPGHLEIMTSIVNSHRNEFTKKLNECLAISLRIDGSVDLTQIDKIYVLEKVINLDGSAELLFIGVAEQKERFAMGLKNAVMEAIKVSIEMHFEQALFSVHGRHQYQHRRKKKSLAING